MKAPCLYYPKCGGCQLQHLGEEDYRAYKRDILEKLFPGQPIIFEWGRAASRRRAEFKIDKSGHLGFFAAQSHEVVQIDHCLAVLPEIDALIIPLQDLAKSIRPEKIFVTRADSGIDINIFSKSEPPIAKLKIFAEQQQIGRITVNESPVLMRSKIAMQFSGVEVGLPVGAFLQPTREGQQFITETIDRMIPKAKKIAEFFCGIGTYSFMLSKKAAVLAFEMNEKAIEGLKGHNRITAQARDIEKFPVQANEILGADVAVLNPPRNGAGPQCKALLKSEVKQIVMISCDPHTLSRDIRIFEQGGFKIQEMIAVDQFHWTQHLETIVKLAR